MIRTAGTFPRALLAAVAAGGAGASVLVLVQSAAEGARLPGPAIAGAGLAGLLLALALRRRPGAPGGAAAIDVLRGSLGLKKVAENDGVRWALRALPERLAVPGYAVLAVLVQNAHDRPRIARVRLRLCPVPRDGPHEFRVALKAGEAGLLRVPVFLPRDLRPGSYLFAVDLSAAAPEGPGVRLLPPAPGRARGAGNATLLVPEAHSGRPLNVWAYEWGGFQPLYVPRQTRPDLDPVLVLEELRAAP